MPMDMPSREEIVRHIVLFDLMRRAHKGHWKDPFELRIRIASRETDPPLPKEDVRKIARELMEAIQWFHGGAIAIEIPSMTARPVEGEPAAYWIFDGYDLVIGSTGYQG
jgi:hypothetical protein